MKRTLTLTLIALSVGSAFGFDFSNIQNWTGSGANQSALVIDWNDGKPSPSLAWGFRWDSSATGLDLIDAIKAADPHLGVELVTFSFGAAVRGFSYDADLDGLLTGANDHQAAGFGFPGEDGYWSYYLGTSASSWGFSGTGADGRHLANGSWDGWSFTAAGSGDTSPSVPLAAPVPEPASLLALGLGAFVLRRRRRA